MKMKMSDPNPSPFVLNFFHARTDKLPDDE
jgi:hypothetical protein